MGFASFAALLEELDDHRAVVSQHFNAVFSDPTAGDHPLAGLWHHAGEEASLLSATDDYGNIGFARPQAAAERVGNLRNGARYRQLDAGIRERFDALVPPIIAASVASSNPDVTLTRSLDLLEAISRRAAYLALLQQYPQALLKVVQLVSSSSWAAQYLQRHPILLDELLDARLLDPVPDWTAFRAALVEQLEYAEPDTERQMDIMREQHHAQVFRLLAQDIAGQLTVERLADHLSQLADTMLEAAIPAVWRKILTRHCEAPRFAVISYGKLGGKELGYASDLDLVFLYDDESSDASKTYGRMGQRLNTWLSAQTAAGQLFDTDLRLRPNGESGLMVSSMAAFRQYQFEAAWPWEHQALTRARFSAGDPAVGAAFEAVRIEVLRLPRDLNTLRTDVIEMRQKMLDNHGTKANERDQIFDIKHDPGGLIDVEFIVQYLILGYAHQHIELTGNLGNIALLRIAGELGLIDAALAERVRNAYRDFRRLQHGLRLNDLRPRVSPDEVADRIAVVRELWSRVFELN
jgi:glutamate-ammonia-ligase adenylyltransferase